MSKLTRSEQIIAEKTVCVLLVRGENPDGERIFAYLAVRADKLESFIEAQKSGTFYPEDYGIIIEAGTGEPSEEVKEKMTKEYGFNHEAMLDIDSPQGANDIASNISSYIADIKEED
ncbi:MAG: hypothetical protein ABL867_04680 [Rickettsiales bacterium]